MTTFRPLRMIAAAGVVTVLCGFIYAAVQQNYRQSANDPQIQMAEDIARKLQAGQPVSSLVTNEGIDIARSLLPFTIIYDDAGQPLASSGRLDGDMPKIPAGVLEAARTKGEHRVTWEPHPGVRHALVIVHLTGSQPGFVAVGRSLREVEDREADLASMTLGAWIPGLVLAGVVAMF